jgi:multisubunit Na+/H+ antiporter MnhF subunit
MRGIVNRIFNNRPDIAMYDENKMRGAGGTPGGIGQFIFGLGMVIAGGYLFLSRVTVMSSYWQLWGYNAFGLSLIPLLLGIGLLFFDGRSTIGWVLTFGGLIIIFAGIIANLNIYFSPTSLTDTMIMLGLLAAGLGLVARSFRSY